MRTTPNRRPIRPITVLLAAVGLVAAAAAPAAAVHGGSDTTAKAHPFVVALETAAGEQWCTGALIAPTKVLTAGHCVAEADDPGSLRVIAGRTDLTGSSGQVRRVKGYRIDPRYTSGLAHDSAVLTLDRPLPQKPVRVARQGDEPLYRYGRTATLFGFGRTGTDGPGTHLKQAQLTLAPPASCAPYTLPEDSPQLKVCGLPRTGTTDSVCKGDSGGPLVVGGVVIGVVSTGNKYCDTQHPVSVFTRATDVPAELLS
ncbi:trypsin [Streptomyces sp. 1114.5]|uniref:S1 family peptidase n=1 Tax=unclassified Streptomyces TaxID=2593676 RepID=UPI000BD9303B|nr:MULTISPECIES: trypsin-like serine protease [unclassified Streptomyces]RKT09766.1 trypsin [Streptomyces sp. 1114.5]SOB88884.1 Trypsin [Streptomyces sp. 1331.2]